MMATKMRLRELREIQLKRRNQTRLELEKDRMGADYLLHPDNKGVKWGIKQC